MGFVPYDGPTTESTTSEPDAKPGQPRFVPFDGQEDGGRISNIMSDFWKNLTSESPKDVLKGGMIGNAVEGTVRKMQAWQKSVDPTQPKEPPIPEGFHKFRPGVDYKDPEMRDDPLYVKDAPEQKLGEVLSQARQYAADHPGATAAEFLKGIAADPELLVPFLGEGGMATKLASVVEKLGANAKIAKVATGLGVGATKGASIGAGIEASREYATGDSWNSAKILGSAAITGTLSSFLGLRRGMFTEHEVSTGNIADPTAQKILNKYNEEIVEKTGEPSKLTIADIKRTMYAELKGDEEINLEQKVSALIRNGDDKKLQKALDKDPKLRAKYEQVMKERGERTNAFEHDPLTEHAEREHVEEERKKRAEALRQQRMEEDTKAKTDNAHEDEQRDRAAAEAKAREIEDAHTERTEQISKDKADTARQSKADAEEDHLGTIDDEMRTTGRNYRGQRGAIDPRMLALLGLTGTGMVIGGKSTAQDKLEGMLAGGLAGAALSLLPEYIGYIKADWKLAALDTAGVAGVTAGATALDREHPVEGTMLGMLWGATKLLPKAKIPMVGDLTIDELINMRNGQIAARERETANVAWAIKKAVPDAVRREEIALAIDKGDLSGLNDSEKQVAGVYKKWTDSLGESAKDAGLIEDVVKNYVTHVVERMGRPASTVDDVMKKLFTADVSQNPKGSPNTPYAKQRHFKTFADLQKALEGTGLQIKTLDLADIARIYGDSMGRAIENKSLLTNLKAAREAPDSGSPLVAPYDSAPPGYIAVQNPQMQGMLVHPDLAKPLQFILEGRGHNDIVNGAVSLALAQKRLAVGFSLFHAANLTNAFIGATGRGPIFAKKAIDAALAAYKNGGAGDTIDTLLKNGLRVERPMEVDQNSLTEVGKLADYGIEKLLGVKQKVGEKTLGTLEKVQTQVFDRLTWDYLHAGMKLAVGSRELERLIAKHPDIPKDKIAAQVSSFVNDTFGGLDWYRVATESRSQLGRRVGLALLNPKGRIALQLGMFAPDWTMSTFRAMYKAIPGSTNQPITKALHQKYVLRTAAIYLTLMNGLNMAMSGHYIWDNKDPTRLEFEDGTSMQVAKHAMEGPEWLLNPRQTAVNKLGIEISLPAEILSGKEFLSVKGASPAIESRTGHIIKKLSPIALSGAGDSALPVEERVKRAALGTIGMPKYGMTDEQRAQQREDATEKRRKKKEAQSEDSSN